ncbi:SHOCT domain-containing protein [Hydrogenophaga sp.]|jgi:putative membrane protein|uniref:SHOCT domain-containing protein n=1 Tax=Hydrogenophaga sp. TaxID=1904254 RepID=UPI0025BBEF19|nr:SHOCT domain-containing protein [Hydrogenophaga sp.]MBT9466946.1 SHOCT domain-containing protein [Hydrogenophaga sp.]
MFNGYGYMMGMHGGWWILLLAIGAALFYVWQRPDPGGKETDDTPRETPHELLRRRLASGAITPQQYEEHKALLDRDN